MSNQHYVPQSFFRNFVGGAPAISMLLTKSGETIPSAPIRKQCAKNNFYGSSDLEKTISEMEGRHSAAIRAALLFAWNQEAPYLNDEQQAWLFEWIVFQRARTELNAFRNRPAWKAIQLEMFKTFVQTAPNVKNRAEIIDLISKGKIQIEEPQHAIVLRSISSALESSLAITDLNVVFLKNRTDFPFVFGESPVIFFNQYCKNIRNRGVLGLQCPGLQIFVPLNSSTCLMLIDPEKYDGDFKEHLEINVVSRSDISQLNALQFYQTRHAIYFGDANWENYVYDLWLAHRVAAIVPQSIFNSSANFLIDGKKPEGRLLHSFEPQIDFDLRLSFVSYQPVAEREYIFEPRSPEIRNELRKRDQELLKNRRNAARVRIDRQKRNSKRSF
jgi:hypothetical protein